MKMHFCVAVDSNVQSVRLSSGLQSQTCILWIRLQRCNTIQENNDRKEGKGGVFLADNCGDCINRLVTSSLF